MIVDGSVVMIENSVHRLETSRDNKRIRESVRMASQEVARPILFGIAIIIAVYLPILTLQGLEGRMFLLIIGVLRASGFDNVGTNCGANIIELLSKNTGRSP